MAKRFIDTNLFNDEWFGELSKDGKLFFIYYITTCDHAGIFRTNKKLLEFQTGIKSLETVIKELGKSIVTVKEGLYFMPKFLKFQYPDFPKSTVRAQVSAIKMLEQVGLWDSENGTFYKDLPKTYQTLNKELANPYVYDNGNDNVVDVLNTEKSEVKISDYETAINEFKKMRVKIKKQMTDHAFNLILKDLETLAPNDEALKIQILNQSIKNSWQDVYPLKQNTNFAKQPEAVYKNDASKWDSPDATQLVNSKYKEVGKS